MKIGKNYEELSAFAVGANIKPIRKVKLSAAIKVYVENCTSNKCPKNQHSEKLYFTKLYAFLGSRGVTYADEITPLHIQEFEAALLKKIKVSSVNRRFNTFKHFFVKCLEWKFINENPCHGMKKRREEYNPYLPWTLDLFERFIKETSGIRTKIFWFLWLTGCRPVEAKNLKWTDINYDELELTLRCGKNAKVSRKFPITNQISKLLHSIKLDSLHVFSDNKKQISNDNLYQYCMNRLKALGEAKYTVYGLRHSFGTRLSQEGANAFDIAELMGHSKMETTRRYVHTNKKNLLKILDKVK